MPWVALYMVVTLILAGLAWAADDRRRMWGLIGVTLAMPLTFWLYNFSPSWILAEDARVGPLWAGIIWLTFPLIVLYQGLALKAPAILGECSGACYVAYAFGWVSEWPAQAAADVLGLAMIASLGGPPIASLIGEYLADLRSSRRTGDMVARHADNHREAG